MQSDKIAKVALTALIFGVCGTAAAEVPIGTVLDWWRPTPTTLVPEGFVVCNGAVVNDPDSPINGTVLPDLTDRFVRGVTSPALLGTAGFTTGGSDTHNHGITHNHPSASTSSAGSHSHGLPASTGSVAQGGSNPGGHSYNARDDNQGWTSNVHLRVDGGSSTQEGQHRHTLGGSTQGVSSHNHTASVPTSTASSGLTNVVPGYVGLLKLCRIK